LAIAASSLLVVVDNLDIPRTWRASRPFEANSPLVIDTDAVLSCSVTLKGFQPIASQGAKHAQTACRAQDSQPFPGLLLDPTQCRHSLAVGKRSRSLVPVAQDHADI
jgi:hypothetical protein